MKLYELMEALSKFPSGADVVISGTLTVKEVLDSPAIDDDYHHLEMNVVDWAFGENKNTVEIIF